MPRKLRLESAAEYLSKVRALRKEKSYDKALEFASEGLFYWMESARDFYLEMVRIYQEMGNRRMAEKMDLEAMRVLYLTMSNVTDGQRAKAEHVGNVPSEPRELRS